MMHALTALGIVLVSLVTAFAAQREPPPWGRANPIRPSPALKYRATIPDFIDLLHVFPAMAEALKIVAISRFKNPARLLLLR